MAEQRMKTDVLVIGGGMAGCLAAIKASEQGASALLVDKGYVSRSGLTPWAMDFCCFNPEWGHDFDAWMRELVVTGEYLNHRDWTEAVLRDSYARVQDLISYGVPYVKTEDGEPVVNAIGGTATEAVQLEEFAFHTALRKHAHKLGVRIVDRTMITDLLTHDNEVVGALGMSVESAELIVFESKATVIATGTYGFKPYSLPGNELTADGDMMAYRAGAEIVGKELTPLHLAGVNPGQWYSFTHSLSDLGQGQSGEAFPAVINGEGEEVPLSSPCGFRELDFEAHAGRTPLVMRFPDSAAVLLQDRGLSSSNELGFTGVGSVAMEVHGSEGIRVAGTDGASSVPGLYAAGDSAGTNYMGSTYCNWGFALGGAGVTGARAGTSAATYAARSDGRELDPESLAAARQRVTAPAERTAGFSPRWVIQVLNGALIPYFVLHVKHGDRLAAALTTVEFLRDHCLPKLRAGDAHEVRLALEAENLVTNAEMKLRASLFRTESRGRHYREDYPRRDDVNWLAWVLLKKTDDGMSVFKEPLPKAWWPDASQTYEQRYPFRFPGE